MNPAARRVRILLVVLLLLHVVVLVRIFGMQIVQADVWKKKADLQHYQTRRLMPRRGALLDRAGRFLATQEPGFHVELDLLRLESRTWRCTRCLRTVPLSPRTKLIRCRGCGAGPAAFVELTVPRPERYATLAPLVGRTPEQVAEDVARTIEEYRARPEHDLRDPDPVYREVSLEVARELHLNAERCPDLRVSSARLRLNHHPDTMPHVVGTAGPAWREHVRQLEPLGFRLQDVRRAIVGRSGLERSLDDRLIGRMGEQRVQVDHAGVVVKVLEDRPPRHGEDIRLSIDLGLQRAAERILDEGGHTGAFVAMDPRTGEVLALATAPRYSPAAFRDRAAYQALLEDPRKPLVDRSVLTAAIPGSVFKIVTALAALDEAGLDPGKRVSCPGRFRGIRCNGTHGEVDLVEALERSCNVYFIHAGIALGRERLEAAARRLGLGAPTGIELPEASGILPTARRAPYKGQLWLASFGQGPVGTTPLQMARVAALVANGGRLIRPTLVHGGGDAPPPPIASARAVGLVREGMRRVVFGSGGTARRFGLKAYRAAAKTGTAERGVTPGGIDLKNNAWLVGYAPHDDPEIAFACYVEGATKHGGEVCGPLVAAWLEVWKAWREGGGR